MVEITGKTGLLGVIGDPIAHTLSPAMHNAAIAHLKLDYVYLPFSIKSEKLAQAIAGFEAINLRGFSVTIPHKSTIIPLLSNVTDIAQSIGAVNTVWRTENGWSGTNTDVTGFTAPLQTKRSWNQATAVILGNGGAARAVVAGCAQLGFREIHLVGRDVGKLAQFKQSWANSVLPVNLFIHPWTNLSVVLPQADLLVNATPLGMSPHLERSPVEPDLMAKLSEKAIVYDLIYNPNLTQFLATAQSQGHDIINGLEMLVQQGAEALQIWLQQPVPVEIMRQSLKNKLGIID